MIQSSVSDSTELESGSENIRLLAAINELHLKYRNWNEGLVSEQIPELAKVNPDLFSIAVTLVDGSQYCVGDSTAEFTLQSISNPFVYGMVLDAVGHERVASSIGVEPTGNPFNAIVLDRVSHRPMNPMVNAGAIAATSLIPGNNPTQRLNNMLQMFGLYIGVTPTINMEAFCSEREHGDRNRSIAYLMRNFDVIDRDIDQTLDLYFQQCSVQVNAIQLSKMAATLANGGMNPDMGGRAIQQSSLRDVLTIMLTCGLYEASGEWVHSVGIPAKSGIGGGMMAVVPGKMGIGIFSPRLDSAGNSVRGIQVCRDLADVLDLHLFSATNQQGKSNE